MAALIVYVVGTTLDTEWHRAKPGERGMAKK
jgi:hypothetical protein